MHITHAEFKRKKYLKFKKDICKYIYNINYLNNPKKENIGLS